MIQPFNSQDENAAPAYWVLEIEHRVMSLAQVLQRFYDEFDPEEPLSFNPLSLIYNPEKEGKRIFSFDNEQVLAAIYRKGFYVIIEKHFRLIEGPHAAFLYYRTFQVEGVVWVATLQISDAMFYNDAAMLSALTLAIFNRDFYQSPKSAEQIVII